MNQILLILSPERASEPATEWAINEASKNGYALYVIYIVDEDAIHIMEKELSETGFVGDKPGEELSSALEKEYTSRGHKKIDSVAQRAQKAGVSVKTELKIGSLLDICEALSRHSEVKLLVIHEKKESFFKKIFEGSESNKLKERILCETKIFRK